MKKSVSLTSIVLWLGLSSVAFGQPSMDPEADKVLKAVQTYTSGLDSLLIKAELIEETVYGDTHKLQSGGTLKLGMRGAILCRASCGLREQAHVSQWRHVYRV